MDKKILGVVAGIAIIIAVAAAVLSLPSSEIITTLKANEKIGLVINSPSQYVTAYVTANITNPYIKSQVNAALALKVHDEEIKIEPLKQEEISEDRLCPTCKNSLVFVEGCSMCIECGYSGCTSG